MPSYYIERTDVSWAYVEADSEEEAREIANRNPELWTFEVGENEVTKQDDE